MEKNMLENFELLEGRVLDALDKTDLEYIRYELNKIKDSVVLSGVGGSSVVSEFGSKVLRNKNEIIAINSEPRDFKYNKFKGFKNVIACSYSGNNYGVNLAFNNDLKHYLLSNNRYEDENVTYLKYNTSIKNEKSFISLGATLIPVSVLLNYYLDGDNNLIYDNINKSSFNFDVESDAFEIFSGIDTSTTSKYLESTFVESGIGIPIVHDKYSYCHGRSTTSKYNDNIAIYLNRNKEIDKILLDEIKESYKDVIILNSNNSNQIIDDYQMLVQAMYLTKYIAEKQNKDLSGVDYNPIVKKLYKYNGEL